MDIVIAKPVLEYRPIIWEAGVQVSASDPGIVQLSTQASRQK